MNLLHKTEELSRFENELFLLYSNLDGGNIPRGGGFGATKTTVWIAIFYDNFENTHDMLLILFHCHLYG